MKHLHSTSWIPYRICWLVRAAVILKLFWVCLGIWFHRYIATRLASRSGLHQVSDVKHLALEESGGILAGWEYQLQMYNVSYHCALLLGYGVLGSTCVANNSYPYSSCRINVVNFCLQDVPSSTTDHAQSAVSRLGSSIFGSLQKALLVQRVEPLSSMAW